MTTVHARHRGGYRSGDTIGNKSFEKDWASMMGPSVEKGVERRVELEAEREAEGRHRPVDLFHVMSGPGEGTDSNYTRGRGEGAAGGAGWPAWPRDDGDNNEGSVGREVLEEELEQSVVRPVSTVVHACAAARPGQSR